MKTVALFGLVVIFAVLAYVRLAPSHASVWHVAPDFSENAEFNTGVQRVLPAAPGRLDRLDKIIRATPRTKVLAGSVEEGMVTYVTRSKWIGFPDYTTVHQADGQLKIHGRLRFGGSDLGVNRARVDGWLGELRGPGS